MWQPIDQTQFKPQQPLRGAAMVPLTELVSSTVKMSDLEGGRSIRWSTRMEVNILFFLSVGSLCTDDPTWRPFRKWKRKG